MAGLPGLNGGVAAAAVPPWIGDSLARWQYSTTRRLVEYACTCTMASSQINSARLPPPLQACATRSSERSKHTHHVML